VQKRPKFCTRSILFCILSGEQLSQGFVHVHLISKKTEIGVGDRWWGIGKNRMKSLTVKPEVRLAGAQVPEVKLAGAQVPEIKTGWCAGTGSKSWLVRRYWK
jgi:hypothetical protein